MKSHHRDLKKWRDCVTDDDFFNDKRNGPGILIFIYELNLKLVEAAYLLYLSRRDSTPGQETLEKQDLDDEKRRWEYYPDNLDTNELFDPYLALKDVFKKCKPQQYRNHLNEWLQAALSTHSADENLMAGEVIGVYERLLKLYAAAWVIHQRENVKLPQPEMSQIAADAAP